MFIFSTYRGIKVELDTTTHMDSSCSSASSSPVHGKIRKCFATVMAEKQGLAFEHHSAMEWIEPQIVFLEQTMAKVQDFDDVHNAIRLLATSSKTTVFFSSLLLVLMII